MGQESFQKVAVRIYEISGQVLDGLIILPNVAQGGATRLADYLNDSRKKFLILLSASWKEGEEKKTAQSVIINKDLIIKAIEI